MVGSPNFLKIEKSIKVSFEKIYLERRVYMARHRTIYRLRGNLLKKYEPHKKHSDGNGLYLYKTSLNFGSWYLIYTDKRKKRKEMSLGKYPDLGLDEARAKCHVEKAKLASHLDPLTEKRKEEALTHEENKPIVTFGSHFEKWFNSVRIHKIKSHVTRRQWKSTINTYCKDILDKPIGEITKEDIYECLKDIWYIKYPTAAKLLRRIEGTFDDAIAEGIIAENANPAIWKGFLAKKFAKGKDVYKPKNHPALDWRLMPKFISELRALNSNSARALEFIILNNNRLSEGLNLVWGEINFESKIWTIPGRRMKEKVEHQIPLSTRSIEILKFMKQFGGVNADKLVFQGQRKNHPFSTTTMEKLLIKVASKLTDKHACPHGFRSTFSDWAAENDITSVDVIDFCLAHAVQGTTKHYLRTKALTPRIEVMQKWSDFCSGKLPAKIIAFNNAA